MCFWETTRKRCEKEKREEVKRKGIKGESGHNKKTSREGKGRSKNRKEKRNRIRET